MIRNIRHRIRKNRGFTLVELMIVVAIVGILAALAIYGVSKYMKNAKTAEARNSLGQMAKDGSGAYLREKMDPAIMAPATTRDLANVLCDGAAATVPDVPAKIAGKKYQSSNATGADYDAGTYRLGWKCLRFSMTEPQYYRYGYATSPAVSLGAEDETFTASAEGNLDGDAESSLFSLTGKIQQKVVTLSPSIAETNAEE